MMAAPLMDVMAAPIPLITYLSTVGGPSAADVGEDGAVVSATRPSAAAVARSREHAALAERTHGAMG